MGCPFSCDFCSRPVFGNLFRRRNLDQVFDEIEQIRSLGYDSLWIADDNFTLELAYLEGILPANGRTEDPVELPLAGYRD